ncbi:transcriptional regulator [Faecalibacter bovis]|uniref:Transcriptional regulator n=1 Tax=Faecalibacter bovis TaxID=2898187 RepID=A0ABX7XCB2_9FLAO|nr:transcriptional regulator [Faecalibacter bovis]MBS7332200.1 transcriptional regulator [Weeksellaceae bacterium]QTV05556.1 transcriptional regulator [Faecalibacter bovis]
MDENNIACDLELFESFSAHLEKTYNFPPLSAKILAYMVMQSSVDGYSFDRLLEVFKVSKSSLSNSINLLLSLNQIEYINKIDSRKRFFRLNPNYVPEKLDYLYEMISNDIYYTKRINDFRIANNLNSQINNSGILDVYLNYLAEAQKLLNDTINKIKTIQLENK